MASYLVPFIAIPKWVDPSKSDVCEGLDDVAGCDILVLPGGSVWAPADEPILDAALYGPGGSLCTKVSSHLRFRQLGVST